MPVLDVCSSCMLRVYGCVFCSILVWFAYMCVRMTPSPRSIAKVPSGRVLPGTPITTPHWYVFLLYLEGWRYEKKQNPLSGHYVPWYRLSHMQGHFQCSKQSSKLKLVGLRCHVSVKRLYGLCARLWLSSTTATRHLAITSVGGRGAAP